MEDNLLITPIQFFLGLAFICSIWVCINLNRWLVIWEQNEELRLAQKHSKEWSYLDNTPFPNTYKELVEYKKKGYKYY